MAFIYFFTLRCQLAADMRLQQTTQTCRDGTTGYYHDNFAASVMMLKAASIEIHRYMRPL